MADKDVKDYFDDSAEQYQSFAKHGFGEKIQLITQNASSGDKFLDVGCGSGAFLCKVLSDTDVDSSVGVDIAPGMLPDESPADALILANARYLPFSPNSFEFIHVDTVLHHIVGSTRTESKEIVQNTLEYLIQLLKDDGWLIITERVQSFRFGRDEWLSDLIFYGLKYGSTALYQVHPNINPNQPPICFFSIAELHEMIEAAGGEIEDTDQFELPVDSIQRIFSPSSIRINIFIQSASTRS